MKILSKSTKHHYTKTDQRVNDCEGRPPAPRRFHARAEGAREKFSDPIESKSRLCLGCFGCLGCFSCFSCFGCFVCFACFLCFTLSDFAPVRFQPQQRSSDSEAYRTLIWEAFRAWSQACEYFAPFIGPRDWASHPLVTTGTILLRYLKIAVAGKAKATLESLDYIGGQRAEALNDDDDDDFATAAAAAAHGKAKETQKKKKVEEKRRKQSPRSNGSSRSNSSSRRTKSPPGNGGAGQESNKWRGKH